MSQEDEERAIRIGAESFKRALRELAKEEPETIRALLKIVWEHISDGSAKWAGRKFFMLVATGLFALSLWLATWRGMGK